MFSDSILTTHGLAQNAVQGISTRHLRRVEGRLFPKVATLRLLARAHGLELDRYLTEVADAAALQQKQ